MTKFDLDAFIRDNPRVLGEGTYKNYLYNKNRVDLPKPTLLEDVGLNPKEVLGQGDYINYIHWRNSILPKK